MLLLITAILILLLTTLLDVATKYKTATVTILIVTLITIQII